MNGEVSRRKLEKIVNEIVQLKDEGHEVVVVSSGAVAAGYRKLGCFKRPESLPEKQAAASIGQGLLMESYSDLFISHGYVASQILITRDDFSDKNRYGNVQNTMNVLLERGIIPIINENDTLTVDNLKFGNNDILSAKVAGLIDADKLIILSDIDGLFNSDPKKDTNAKLLKNVQEITSDIEAVAGDAGSAVGTGGMRSKLDAVKIAMASGIPVFLGKADSKNILYDAVNKKAKGTYFEQKKRKIILNKKKCWIAFHSEPEGELTISKRVKQDMVESKKNLDIKDIYNVKGPFLKEDVVRIVDPEGEELGLGVVSFSSDQLKVLKQQSMEKLQQYPDCTVVDRNDFVYFDISVPANL
ncbi:glutamate 5-kinase [Chengkuizengella axinellae]